MRKLDATAKDRRVIRALDPHFETFRLLAVKAANEPAARPGVEAEMAVLLNAMSPSARLELRRALKAAGAMDQK